MLCFPFLLHLVVLSSSPLGGVAFLPLFLWVVDVPIILFGAAFSSLFFGRAARLLLLILVAAALLTRCCLASSSFGWSCLPLSLWVVLLSPPLSVVRCCLPPPPWGDFVVFFSFECKFNNVTIFTQLKLKTN